MTIKATNKISIGSYKFKKGEEVSLEIFQALPFNDGQENCEFVDEQKVEKKQTQPKEVKDKKPKPE